MKRYLIDTFQYNDFANRLVLGKVAELPEKNECIRLFSHMINSMDKWLGRIEAWPGYAQMDWWIPVYPFDELERKWDECLRRWVQFIDSKTEEGLMQEVEWCNPEVATATAENRIAKFPGSDRKANFAGRISDIALQLNYHSIHHRAQIQYLVRQQGVTPEFVDYIGTRYRRI